MPDIEFPTSGGSGTATGYFATPASARGRRGFKPGGPG
jgi:hypothetical protein